MPTITRQCPTFILVSLLLVFAGASRADEAAVVAEIQRHADAAGVHIGVSAVHLETGRRIRLHAREPFPLASTYKVPMAAYALQLIGNGELTPDQLIEIKPEDLVISSPITRLFPHPGIKLSVMNLMEATLIQSDNTATDVLLSTIGGGEAVTGWLRKSGIDGMRVDRSTADLIRDYQEMPGSDLSMALQYEAMDFDHLPEAEWVRFYDALLADPRDQGTPDAMVTLLSGIWQDAYLASAEGEALRAMMARCLTGSARLSGLLPAQQLPLAHKTGTLGGTVNDVGVVSLPDDRGTLVLAVFSRASSMLDAKAGERAIAEISRTLYDYFLFSEQ